MKKNTRSDYVVQTLIDGEDMSADLASLYPAASKIGDAAASFIDKADATIAKKDLFWPVCRSGRGMHRHLPERRQGGRGHQPSAPQSNLLQDENRHREDGRGQESRSGTGRT